MVVRHVQDARSLAAAADADLAARALRNDGAAVRAIIQRYNRRLYRIARSIMRDDAEAEDVVQEAYVRAFAGLAGFRGESGLGTWLTRIVLNEALGRRRRRRPTVELATVGDDISSGRVIPFPLVATQPDPERTMAQREIHAVLEQAIDELPDAFRTVLVARAIEEMSVDETAELLGIRPETVKTRLHRARRLLRQSLERRIGAVVTDAFPFAGERCDRMADAVMQRLGFSD